MKNRIPRKLKKKCKRFYKLRYSNVKLSELRILEANKRACRTQPIKMNNGLKYRVDSTESIDTVFDIIKSRVPKEVYCCIIYDKDKKQFISTVSYVNVYHDPIHSVLDIKWK